MLVGLVWIELLVLLFAGIGLVFPLFLVLLELVWFGFPTFLGFVGIGLVFAVFLVLLELVWFGFPTFLQSAGSRSRLSGRESADSGET